MPGSRRGPTDLREWRVEVGGVVRGASDALTVTFIHIEDDSYRSQTHPSLAFSFVEACSSSEVHQLLPSSPPSPSDSHTPPLSHVSDSSGPRFSSGFTLLGDGPVAVALVVRWSACLGISKEEGGRSREWIELGGILLSSLWLTVSAPKVVNLSFDGGLKAD